MAGERIDVLAVMDSVYVSIDERYQQMREARAAVAELIEAAKEVGEMEHEPRFLYGAIASLRAALARIGATP